MSEGTIHLYRDVPLLVAEGDVRTHHSLRSGLSTDLFLVAQLILLRTVWIGLQTRAVVEVEDTQRLSHHLEAHIAGAVEPSTP